MTSFLKGLLRGNHSKHKRNAWGAPATSSLAYRDGDKELLEDWASVGRDAEAEVETAGGSGSSEGDILETSVGTSYNVKYLGSSLVDSPNGEAATAEAIKVVIAMSKASRKKLRRVILSVNLRGIKVIDSTTNEVQFDISIYRISYCSADAAHNHVFAFIATNQNETMECHAFLCRKRKLAQKATLAIARTFNTAYELWQLSHDDSPTDDSPNDDPELPEKKFDLNKHTENDYTDCAESILFIPEEKKMINGNSNLLIDFTKDVELTKKENSWVLFDEEDADFAKRSTTIMCPNKNEKNAFNWGEDNGAIDLLSLP